jgi:hypothetical protein
VNSRELLAAAARLRDRDLALLDALYQHRFLTRPQIQTLFFADHPDPRSGQPVATLTPRAPQRRLQRLHQAGLIVRRTLTRPDGRRDPDPYYCLTPDGAAFVAHRNALPVTDSRRRAADALANPLFVRHALAAADLHCELAREARSQPGHACPPQWWQGEQAASQQFQHHGRELLLRPDGYTRYQAGRDIHHLLIEIDLATMTLRRLEAKLDRYRTYSHSQAWEQRYPVFPKLLLLTTSPQRIDALHERLGPVPELVLLSATHTDIHEHGPLAPIWKQPGYPWARSLLAPT